MEITPSKQPLVWLGTNSCDGNIISFLNTNNPSLRDTLQTNYSLFYNAFVMAAEGEKATAVWNAPELRERAFIFVMEGTVSTAYGGRTTLVGKVKEKDVTALEVVRDLGARAAFVVAAGTCAAFGGPYIAWPNPTGSLPLSAILKRQVINVPGCPVHPGWILQTLEHLRLKKKIKLDSLGRPRFLFSNTIHNRCERLPLYQESIFAQKPGDPGCLYLVGCKGPVTKADCPQRRWIGEKSGWPVGVNTPCIGCTSPEFPDDVAPFFQHRTDIYSPFKRVNLDKIRNAAAAFTLSGIVLHLLGQVITGRVKLRMPAVYKGIAANVTSYKKKVLCFLARFK